MTLLYECDSCGRTHEMRTSIFNCLACDVEICEKAYE